MTVAAHKKAIPRDSIDENKLTNIRARHRMDLENFAAEMKANTLLQRKWRRMEKELG